MGTEWSLTKMIFGKDEIESRTATSRIREAGAHPETITMIEELLRGVKEGGGGEVEIGKGREDGNRTATGAGDPAGRIPVPTYPILKAMLSIQLSHRCTKVSYILLNCGAVEAVGKETKTIDASIICSAIMARWTPDFPMSRVETAC